MRCVRTSATRNCPFRGSAASFLSANVILPARKAHISRSSSTSIVTCLAPSTHSGLVCM